MVGYGLLKCSDQGTVVSRLACVLSPAQLALCIYGAQGYPAEAGTWQLSTKADPSVQDSTPFQRTKG